MNTQRTSLLAIVMLWACAPGDPPKPAEGATTSTSAPASAPTASASSPAPAAQLDASRGKEIGTVYEAYLSPWQEGDEEQNTPQSTPTQFRSTTASLTRAQRDAAGHRAHGQLRFSKDLSRAWVDVQVQGVDLAAVNMFHIHCGRPGILGPIVVDFSQGTNVKQNIADGTFSVELTDADLVKTSQSAQGAVGEFTMGCVIPSPSLGSKAPVKYSTIAGLARLARDGELYFNLHTTGQTYYGDIRGQLEPRAAER
jgi:hypothetical protein